MDSILTSVKKLLGITETDTSFDPDIIMHINSAFMVLNQIGIGPSEGFMIESKSETWDEFTEDNIKLEAVKSFVGFKVRLMFDPPTSSSVTDAINKNLSELEWRLNFFAENGG